MKSSRILPIPYQVLTATGLLPGSARNCAAILMAVFPLLPARRLELVQRPAQRFQLPFIGELLVLGQLHQSQHFLHFLQRLFQGFDNPPDILNGLADG